MQVVNINGGEQWARVEVIGFISEFHHLARRNFPFKTIKVKSNRQNACDVGLAMYVVSHLIYNKHVTNVIIASRDNFAGACVECINTNLCGLSSEVKAVNAYDISNVIEHLKDSGAIEYDVCAIKV